GNWFGGYFHGYANFAYPYPWDYGPATNWWWNGPATWQWGTDENPVFPMYNNRVSRNPWLTVRQSDNKALFVDDTWILNDRITFNLGFRWDNSTAGYGEGAVYELNSGPEGIENPVFLRSREGLDVFDFDTFSPRLGVIWTMTDDAKTVMRFNVGRYYAPMSVETLRRFGPDMEPAITETWRYDLPMSEVDLNKNGKIDFEEVRPATRLLVGRTPTTRMATGTSDPTWALEVADGTSAPYTDQFTVSLQRQLGSDFAIEASYIYKISNDFLSLRGYNTDTGQFWEWEPKPFTTFTDYQTNVWSIKLQDYDGDGDADINDAKYVLPHTKYRVVNMSSFAGQDIDRTYNGIQLVLNKRYSNRWQGLASLNWNTSDGIAPRITSQDWYIDGPMIMDTPFGSSMNHFQNNTSGALPMTPELMIKISGSYRIPVAEADFGLRLRYDDGRAIFPIESLPVVAGWMSELPENAVIGTWGDQIVATDPDEPYWMPATTIFDLSLQKEFTISNFGLNLSVDVLNAFNENSPNRIGFKTGDFGRVYSIVQPRTLRGGVKFTF
ncbi:MAG TPA: TonB-dependent receptor, partial [Thermoanaerobaculia bacterium]|nr:TonB-dependent receptor [Thermoanaerobaculia bacterium]